MSPSSRRPIRVVHVIHHLQPGGMEYGLVKLVNGLAGGEVESVIVSTTTPNPAMLALLHPDVRVVTLARRAGNDPTLVWQLFRAFRRERPDVVHTHAWGTLVEGYVAARLARVPVLLHGEHGTLQTRPGQIRAQRFVWSRVDRVLSVSSRLAERMATTVGVPQDRITVVRNGVDLERFGATSRRDARHALGVTEDALVLIGHAGRLVEVKNQALLVAAAARLAAQGRRCRVLIAGEGPLREALQGQIDALGLESVVTLLGHRADVERFFAALDVYVLCSTSEGMPNTILEAMAARVAVVATRVGGVDELVVEGETGLMVPSSDEAGLADALRALVDAPERRQAMAESGRRRALERFSVGAMVAGYAAVYRDVAGARAGSTPLR
ncbi:glycosyltransferase [Luteitalea sp.]